jgi:hypothetical protein
MDTLRQNTFSEPSDLRTSTVGDIAPNAFWILGIVQEDDGSLSGPATWQASYLSDCVCPDDCLRDHETD